jgi:hypothetical protein
MPSIARHHADWLSLIEVNGPFLSMPVLLRTFPQELDGLDPDVTASLRRVMEEWDEGKNDPAIHTAWARWVLRDLLKLPDDLLTDEIPSGLTASVAEHHEILRPDLVLFDMTADGNHPEGIRQRAARLLVQIYPAGQGLESEIPGSRWKAPPSTRMMELLHATDVRLGLVTNGERWMLVDAPRGETTGFTSWYGSLWTEEQLTLRAFRSLLGARRWFGVPQSETIEALLQESASDQQDVTEGLGRQVRKAVEILIQALDRIDKDRNRELLRGVDEKGLYEATLTVMMRLVFLMSAEERELLARGNSLYDGYYAVSTLRAQLREAADAGGEEVLERRNDAWGRLLATFRAVHGGVEHDAMRLPAYGGTLFDPDRFPFLEGRPPDTGWRTTPARPLPVHNRTVLHLLEALQLLQVKVPGGGPAEARLLSFRALGIEQIGHVYEGLLDHTAVRATEPVLGLAGPGEPEFSLARLEDLRERGEGPLLAHLKKATGRGEATLARALAVGEIDERRLRSACDNDEALIERVRPFAELLRADTSGYPVVIAAGSVYVTQGPDRRSTGTYYTPRSLTEPIVRYTLEPLVYDGPDEGKPKEEWRLRPAKALLDLKVCDMATGSGAFLVQACRYLAERLVEAWADAEAAQPGRVVITPEGALSTGAPEERPIPRDGDERLLTAMRIVADRCLYGVDVNPMAVEMAKLSLWLLTLQRDRPFTFLDHAIRCGDSLLGVDIDQFLTWNLAARGAVQNPMFRYALEKQLRHAIRLRRKIEAMEDVSVRDTEEKADLLRQAEEAMAIVKLGADLLIGTGLLDRKERGARLDAAQMELQLTLAVTEERRGASYKPHVLEEDRARLAALRAEADRVLRGRRPFHWPLEFPEVFVDPDMLGTPLGFDALVGNPPFMGGQKITGRLGTDYRDYLVEHIGRGKRGSADLCAYFFLRGRQLLRARGGLGMLATNTIAQGDTREVGLEQIVESGSTIPRAVASRKWPGTANLEVAHVWVRLSNWPGPYILDDQPVAGVTPFLSIPGAVAGKPYRLAANTGKSFIGSYVLGMGFILTPEEAQKLVEKDPRNREVLFPYLNGEDLNSRPDQSPSRWVINFRDWPLERAETYPDCMKIVREKVKPERDKLAAGDATARDRARRWWQFARPTMNLYATIAGMERVLVVSLVSNHVSVAFSPAHNVFAHKLGIFPLSEWGDFALLQSHVHYHWAWTYSSTMRVDLNYSPSDCFDTLPFPPEGTLEDIGRSYYSHRRSVMASRGEGLTKTYNRFHDPSEMATDISGLRTLHVQLDHAVLDVYGWKDIGLCHDFYPLRHGLRFTMCEKARREVLVRLLTLNHERYEEEVRQGLHDGGTSARPRRKKGGRDMEPLFGEEAS